MKIFFGHWGAWVVFSFLVFVTNAIISNVKGKSGGTYDLVQWVIFGAILAIFSSMTHAFLFQ